MKKKYKVLAVVAARGGSKGIKNKNLRLINGKPLVYYSIRNLLKSNFVDTVCLSTDSKKIMETVKEFYPNILSESNQLQLYLQSMLVIKYFLILGQCKHEH